MRGRRPPGSSIDDSQASVEDMEASLEDTGEQPKTPSIHRPKSVECDSFRDVPEPMIGSAECSRHSDCSDGLNGRCTGGGGVVQDYCNYDLCLSDGDCPGQICNSGGDRGVNYCCGGNCIVDGDCGENGYCSPSKGDCGLDFGHYCHTDRDDCVDDMDCENAGVENVACTYDPTAEKWSCSRLERCSNSPSPCTTSPAERRLP